MSIKLVMPSNYLILCHPLLLLPSIFPGIRVFSNKSALRIRWPKYWSFSFSISPSNEYSGLISFRMNWLGLLAVQGTLKSLLQHHSSKALILQCSAQRKHNLVVKDKHHFGLERSQLCPHCPGRDDPSFLHPRCPQSTDLRFPRLKSHFWNQRKSVCVPSTLRLLQFPKFSVTHSWCSALSTYCVAWHASWGVSVYRASALRSPRLPLEHARCVLKRL